jgi:flagellar hook-associated protein 2
MRGIGSQNASSPFRTNRAVSDDTDILEMVSANTFRMSGSRQANSDFDVEVLQLAQAQQNEGTALNANASATSAGFATGNHRISINMGDRQFDFNFSVNASDTVEAVQNRIANAINTRNIGVTASVNTQGSGNARTSALTLESSETGVARAGQPNFTVSSTAGNAAQVTGVNAISQDAQNAQFRVNRGFTGALQTSRTNEVDFGFNMRGRLQDTGTTQVTMGRDETGQINAFRHMVNSFNDLSSAANSSPRLQRELGSLMRGSTASLRRIGIDVSGGRMSIDEDRMQAAAERGDLESFVQSDRIGGSSGFMNRLTRIASDADRNPGTFIQPDNSDNPFFGTNSRMLTQLHQSMNIGMLFDTFM